MKELLELSWQTQIVIVGGYIAYVIAYSGRRKTHRAFDTFAIILCFGGLALFTLSISDKIVPASLNFKTEISAVAAVLVSIIASIAWRRWFRSISRKCIRFLSKSEDDGLSTAWESVTQLEGLSYSQINVLLTDGRTLESYQLEQFNKLPNGPFVMGDDGSIALYVNYITEDNNRREAKNIIDDDGSRMTFIPASQIVEVDFRRSKDVKKLLTCFHRFFHR